MKRRFGLVVMAVVGLTACGSSSSVAPMFVHRAVAAWGVGPIIHVVSEQPTGVVDVSLKTGRSTPSDLREELWTDQSGQRLHLVMSEGHRIVGDLLLPQDAARVKSAGPSATAYTSLAFLWTGYRAMLTSPALEPPTRGTFEGRAVYWLRFKPAPPTAESPHPPTREIALDAKSYEPVVFRVGFQGHRYDERILLAKRIPYGASDFQRQGPSLLTSASLQGTSSWETGTSSSQPFATHTVVRRPWLTAGKTVGGLKLSAAIPLTVTRKHKPTLHGIQLIYGRVEEGLAGANSTTVDELPVGDPAIDWSNIPADAVQVQESHGTSSRQTIAHPQPHNTPSTEWTGYLKRDNLYITIYTTKGQNVLLAIARNLQSPSK